MKIHLAFYVNTFSHFPLLMMYNIFTNWKHLSGQNQHNLSQVPSPSRRVIQEEIGQWALREFSLKSPKMNEVSLIMHSIYCWQGTDLYNRKASLFISFRIAIYVCSLAPFIVVCWWEKRKYSLNISQNFLAHRVLFRHWIQQFSEIGRARSHVCHVCKWKRADFNILCTIKGFKPNIKNFAVNAWATKAFPCLKFYSFISIFGTNSI